LIELDVKPMWPKTTSTGQPFDIHLYERMCDIEPEIRFDHIDLEICIKTLYSIPKKHSADVRVQICFPDFIWSCCLDELKEQKANGEEDEDEEGSAGAVYFTKTTSNGKECLQPVLNQTKMVRIYQPFKKKALNWFQNGSLMLGVDGCMPKDPRRKKQERMKLAANPGMAQGGGGSGPAPIAGVNQGPSAFDVSAYSSLQDSVKQKEKKLQDQANEIVKLKCENDKLQNKLKDAANNKSGACTIS